MNMSYSSTYVSTEYVYFRTVFFPTIENRTFSAASLSLSASFCFVFWGKLADGKEEEVGRFLGAWISHDRDATQ